MPREYDDNLLDVYASNNLDGTQRESRVYSLTYPPIGFFPFAQTDNGDYHGFYWPIGREEQAPLVAYSSHDAYALIPEYGDIQSAYRCQVSGDDCESQSEFRSALKAANAVYTHDDAQPAITSGDHQNILKLDPLSPFRNCAVADQLVAENKLDEAELHYETAIRLLPEYGAAHFGLGYLLRRTRRPAQASIHLRQSLICPLAFWGGCFWADHILPGSFRGDWARKALLWLQQLKEPHETLRDDPWMRNVQAWTLDTGVAESRDIELSIALVDEYQRRGQHLDAINIWITIGDRAALETTSFRARYGMTPRSYGRRLADLFRTAGIGSRAELVENMLLAMDKPDGIFL